ncbi:Collagen type IV alpha-3-binding protein [Trichoplax sp. H2]|nr:Collagen type IV alpha-3-binding protein [Trichoplax sp. H2]|eukprot:RDD40692.1 Collagen type IV alpha-3-binding protein [Trichoplax sp. H2]
MFEEENRSLSESDDDSADAAIAPTMQGTLSKWTNYIHGWQDRWFILRDGTLAYFKSESELSIGCRGSISIRSAAVECHEFDDCRFDVSISDQVYYLRAKSKEERQRWIDALETSREASPDVGETNLRRQGSMMSISSYTSLSTASTSSTKRDKNLKEKLLEMETYREILCRQVDTLQRFFDKCSDAVVEAEHKIEEFKRNEPDMADSLRPPSEDIRIDEADSGDDEITEGTTLLPKTLYKLSPRKSASRIATYTTSRISSLINFTRFSSSYSTSPGSNNISQVANSIDEKERIDAITALELLKSGIDFKGESITFKATTAGILATLSHCIDLMLTREDKWRKRLEREMEKRRRLQQEYKQVLEDARKRALAAGPDYQEGPNCMMTDEEFFDAVETALDKEGTELNEQNDVDFYNPDDSKATLMREMDSKVSEYVSCVREEINEEWNLVHEDNEMKVYRRELEIDGVALDPLRAQHIVDGVTGHEVCNIFFDKDVRMEWETTLESTKVIEEISQDTLVFHQLIKRVWPTAQRDMCFASHMRPVVRLENDSNPTGVDPWIVVNYSIDHPLATNKKYVRVQFTVCMYCETIIRKTDCPLEELTRNDIASRIVYIAHVNPGGWAPPAVVRVVTKREYPKFLRKFSSYVDKKLQNTKIVW